MHELVYFHHHIVHFHTIKYYLSTYGYGFVFLGTVFEGELILLTAGFFSYLGAMNFWAVLFFGFLGATLGDNLWFYVGRRGGTGLIDKYGKFLFLTKKRVARAQKYFDQHGSKTIFFSRFIFGTRISSAILAGALGMPRSKFFKSNVIGAGVWSILTTILGFLFGNSFDLLRGYLHQTEKALLILAIGALIILLLRFLFTIETT